MTGSGGFLHRYLMRYISCVLMLATLGRSSALCWSHETPQIPTVGFDIGLTQCTSSVGFPNGTFIDIALVETEVYYQACILSRIRNGGRDRRDRNIIYGGDLRQEHVDDRQKSGYLRQTISWVQSTFGLTLPWNVEVAPYDCLNTTNNSTQSYMRDMITILKARTEEYLQSKITEVTITSPGYFTPQIKSDLHMALNWSHLSIQCNEIYSSALSATFQTRHTQFFQKPQDFTTPTECILGNFNMEEVVAIDYTGDVFTSEIFQLYIGHETWSIRSNQSFIMVRASSSTASTELQYEKKRFWGEIETRMRRMMIDATVAIPSRSIRLVLTGSSATDGEMLSVIQNALGALLPSNTTPRAIHFVLSKEEIAEKASEEEEIRRGFTCRYPDEEGPWVVKDYEPDLLDNINFEAEVDVDGKFLASHGGALLGLLGRGVGCKERERALQKSWWRDNERKSTFKTWPDDGNIGKGRVGEL
ncbi:hypothetical protein B0J14DRAFT_594546 [Halenospora varia]|nr:hypothetical protein B0J14DRAFT_594546 [Halenospora varia]